MMEIREDDSWSTCRPHGGHPESRFALWRPALHSDIELQTGICLDTLALPFHFHDSYQFDVMLKGARSYRLGPGVRTGMQGSLCAVHPAEGHAVRLAGQGCSFRTMHVHPERLRQACEEITARKDFPTFDFQILDAATVKLFLAAHRAAEIGDPFEVDCLLTAFLENLVARHGSSRTWLPGIASHACLQRACRYIEAHLTASISLDDLVATTGLSKYHLVRQFTQAFGLPPHSYQIRLRIARARELLARALAVKRVSAELGFADQSHFGRHFRKATGLTPAEYQRRATGRVQAEIRMSVGAKPGHPSH